MAYESKRGLISQQFILFEVNPVEEIAEGDRQDAQTVNHAVVELDGGGLGEIFRGAGHFGYLVPLVADLGDDLVVEHEVVRAAVIVDGPQHLRGVGAVARVVLGQLVSHQKVLQEGEETVAHVFV